MATNILRFMVPKSLVVYINESSTVRQALEKMNYHKYTAVPVIDGDGKYVGTLRSDDIFKYFMKVKSFDKALAEDVSITEIMDRANSKPVPHNTSMSELIEGVKEHNFVSVVDDRGCFIGIILRREILNYLLDFYRENI